MIVSGIFLQTEGSYGAGGLCNHGASLQRSAPSVESMFAAKFKLRRSAPPVELKHQLPHPFHLINKFRPMKPVSNPVKHHKTTAANWLAPAIMVFALLISILPCQGQSKAKIDSLLFVIQSGEKNIERVDNLYALAKQYYYISNYESALKYANNSLDLANELKYSKGSSQAFNLIGQVNQMQGDFEAASRNIQASLEITEKTGDKKGSGLCYSNLGNLEQRRGNPKEALQYYYKALEIMLEFGDKSQEAGLYGNMGASYKNLGNNPEALKNHMKSLDLYNELGDKRGAANALGNLALIQKDKGNYPEALKYHLAGIKLQEEIGNKNGMATGYLNISILYSRLNNKAEQLNYLMAALRIFEETGSRQGTARTYDNIGKFYLSQNNLEDAMKYLSNSLAIYEEIGDKIGIAGAYTNISAVKNLQGNYTEALEYGLSALELRREAGVIDHIINSLNNIAITYKQMGDYHLARKCLEECFTLSETIRNKNEIKNGYLLLTDLDSLEGKFDQALQDYKMYIIYKDSLSNEESQRQIAELQLEYETEKKDKEIELLNKDNEIKTLQLSKQRAIRHGMIAGIVLLFITGFLLFRSFRLRKKLEQHQAIISERRRISADLHDDVGSGLSRIMLLTELVKNEAKTPEMQKEAEKIASISKELSANISEIIWALNANNDYLESLVAYIRRYAAEFFDDSAVSLKIHSTGAITGIPISGELRREIFYTVKEALHNIYKHSKATEAKLGFSVKDDILTVSIQDNGVGIPEKETGRYGNGLTNMQQRTAAAGGRIRIENHQGTKITLEVPVK